MTGLFNPLLLASHNSGSRFELRLDAAEPYLNDHRPGGEPLFPTVMGIEAMAAGARMLTSSAAPAWVAHVSVKTPYILAGSGPHGIELRIRRTGDPATEFDCVLLTRSAPGSETIHLEARVTLGNPPAEPLRQAISPIDSNTPPRVTGERIYQLFFHGPAYQVVASAQWRQDRVISRLKQGLPPSHRAAGGVSEMAPRLIELGLQTAGLLELGSSGRMMIPHSMASIVRRVPVDVDYHGPVFACARYGSSGAGQHMDIEILDEHGTTLLGIQDYRTVPLPFVVDAAGQARLRARLLGVQSGLDDFPKVSQLRKKRN